MNEPGAFAEAMASRPLLLDAAMGTRLIARGLVLGAENTAAWNLLRPEAVLDIHRRDVAAGSDAVLANTFRAGREALAAYGLGDRFEEINRRAVAIAREAAGPGRFVLGGLGPADDPMTVREQAIVLAGCGVDALLLETFTPRQLTRAACALPRGLGPAVLASLCAWDASAPSLVGRLLDRGVAAVGINCQDCNRATALLGLVRAELPDRFPLLVKPSSGGGAGPESSPEQLAGRVPGWIEQGARLIGGCCGTDESHVAGLRAAIDTAAPR